MTLIFTEPVTPAGAGIKVFDPSGRQVAGQAVARGSVLTSALIANAAGTYVVSWQVVAADTHPSRGAFAFVVGSPSANPYSALLSAGEIGTTTPVGLALQAIARWVHFIGFALVFGVIAYQLLTGRRERPRQMVGAGIVLLIAAEPLSLVAQLASLSFDGDTVIAVLASGFGRLLALRLGAALLAWAVLTLEAPWPVLAIGAAVAGLDGASAHAIQGLAGAGLVLTAVHVTAMGLWVGGLAAYFRAPDPRFPRYAAIVLGVAAGSGLLLAIAHIGPFEALFTTSYGYVLIVKVLIVVGAIGAAVLHRHRPEGALVPLIVAAAALLAALPPPR